MKVVYVLVACLVSCGLGNPCIQTSTVQYDCPPFPPQSQEFPGIEGLMTPAPDWGYTTYKGSGKLTGKVALITGGDSGIGRAVALAYAREGAEAVVISYLNEDVDAAVVVQALSESGCKALAIPGDIANETHVAYIVNTTVAAFGKIDILVNNAATQPLRLDDFLDLDHDRILYTYQVNILSMYDFARYSIPHMKAGSAIINTASVQAYNPSWEVLDYAGTKGAIITFTKGLAQYSIQKGIRTNGVAPGPVWTPLIVTSWPAPEVATFGQNNSDLGRPAQPAELAPVYVYLASEESSYTNGAMVGVNGGFFLP